MYQESNRLVMSAASPENWNILRPTENAKKYESSLWPANQERIIELESEPKVEEIEVMSYDREEGVLECTLSYRNGESKDITLLSRKVQELVYRDRPALVVAK